MECIDCGTEMALDAEACPECSAPAPSAVRHDPPTEVLPAVVAASAAAVAPPAGRHNGLAPPLDLPPAEPVALRGGRRVAVGELAGGALAGAIVVLLAVAAMGALGAGGPLAGLFGADPDGQPPAAVSATESPRPSASPPVEPIEGFTCQPQQVAAPSAGGWLLYRAEFGTRGRFDFLRLKLRRDGAGDAPASLGVERLAVAEAAARYGVEAPAGAETALAVTFDGPVRISAPFGGRPGYGVLKDFRVVRDGERGVRVVLAVAGDGCYTLSAGDWQAGQATNATDITLEIARP